LCSSFGLFSSLGFCSSYNFSSVISGFYSSLVANPNSGIPASPAGAGAGESSATSSAAECSP